MSVLTFNGHAHAEDEVGIKIESRTVESPYRQPMWRVETWTIVGALRAEGTDLATAISTLESKYVIGTAVATDTTFTANSVTHTMDASETLAGIRVKRFGYLGGPWKMRTELSNRRAFYAQIQAEYALSGDVFAYRERIDQFGNGGPKWRYMPSLVGFPEYQTLQAATPIKYVQRGALVLRSTQPAANSIYTGLTGTAHHGEQMKIGAIAPQQFFKIPGGAQTEELHGVEWTYVSEVLSPISITNFDVPTL